MFTTHEKRQNFTSKCCSGRVLQTDNQNSYWLDHGGGNNWSKLYLKCSICYKPCEYEFNWKFQIGESVARPDGTVGVITERTYTARDGAIYFLSTPLDNFLEYELATKEKLDI